MQRDSAACDAWARASAGSGLDSTAAGGVGGAAVGSALGAGLGAIAGSFFGAADTGAALGAALGGVQGAAHGAAGSAAAWDARLTAAYRNCMAARGYVVEGTVVLPATPAAPGTAIQAQTGTDDRLRQLDDLKAQGLVSHDEYRRKHAEIVGYENVTTEDRLLELRDLLRKKLISQDEYVQKRREILDAL